MFHEVKCDMNGNKWLVSWFIVKVTGRRVASLVFFCNNNSNNRHKLGNNFLIVNQLYPHSNTFLWNLLFCEMVDGGEL